MKRKRWLVLQVILIMGGMIAVTYGIFLMLGVVPLEAKVAKKGETAVKLEPTSFQGYASWYGKSFHGLRTSSGEHYDMFLYTAAHRSLPLGTWVRVTNLSNGKIVWVRINDRGPYHSDRIIDLSYQAAKDLGMVWEGTEEVKVEIVDWDKTPPVDKNDTIHHLPSADNSSAHNLRRA